MSNNSGITLKTIWLFLNAGLLLIAVFSWLLGAENLLGICGILIMLLSFPGNLLVGWIFFAFGNFTTVPVLTLLMLLAFSVIGYLQWFKLVPQIVKFFSKQIPASHNVAPLPEANADPANAAEWKAQYYDAQKRTPVERVIED